MTLPLLAVLTNIRYGPYMGPEDMSNRNKTISDGGITVDYQSLHVLPIDHRIAGKGQYAFDPMKLSHFSKEKKLSETPKFH